MARSVSERAMLQVRSGSFRHALSRSRLSVSSKGDTVFHRVERDELAAELPVALAIGSGKVGQSFAVTVGQYLYESPISWFSQRARFDLSPGFEQDVAPDFDRRIEPECLNCHTSGASQTISTIRPISCERCHPESVTHFANPAAMDSAERNRVCESCHLQGEARILNPGSSWADTSPSFTTYVASAPSPGLKVVSQVEQLALSKCVREGKGHLWCGSCHNPHGPSVSVEQVCLSCHKAALSSLHTERSRDCASCHMPRQRTPEVAHTAYTDHRIQIPGSAAEQPERNISRTLYAWREPAAAVRERNLGLAYVYAGQRHGSADWIQKGFALLLPLQQKDADVYSALGSILIQKQRPVEAASMYREAVRLMPARAEGAHNLAVAFLAGGDVSGAVRELERAILLDPYFERSWLVLTQLYTQARDSKMRASTIDRYLRVAPQNLTFQTLKQQAARRPR